jgi:hypothetical protein
MKPELKTQFNQGKMRCHQSITIRSDARKRRFGGDQPAENGIGRR